MAQAAVVTRPSSSRRGLFSLSGDAKLLLGVLTISSYVNAGGEALDLTALFPSLVPAGKRLFIHFQPTSGRQFYFDPANNKVSAFTAAGVEVANATNIGAVPFVAWIQ